jgi:hypothetical protein
VTAPDRPRALIPFPATERKASADLDLNVKVAGPGGWISLEDDQYYALHADSFSSAGTSWRKIDVNAPWLEGSYTVGAVRENVTETVAVWVRGETHYVWRCNMAALEEAFTQVNYMLMKRIEDLVEYWTCPSPADFTIETQREFVHARIGVFRAQVIRLPRVTIVPASADEV